MSPRMVRMLKYLAVHDVTTGRLKRANQITLRGLALRGYVSQSGITASGMEALHSYQRSEWIGRKAENRDFSDGVMAALDLIRIRKGRVG